MIRRQSIAVTTAAIVILVVFAPACLAETITSWGFDGNNEVTDTPAGTDFTAIAAGGCHSLAIKSDGSIVSWGYDRYNQVTGTPAGTDFTTIAGGGFHSLALASDGSIVCWGADWCRQVTHTPAGKDFTAIAGGVQHSLALKADGSIVSWGSDYYDQVSDTPAGTDFTAIAGGGFHSLALKADGSIVSWGYDGNNEVTDTPAGTDFTAIAAGDYHSLAIKSDGSIVSWGRDNYDQVTDTPAGTDFTAIAAGDYHSLAIKSDGSIVSWGRDNYDQVTDTPAGTDFTAIAAGVYRSLALTHEPTTPPVADADGPYTICVGDTLTLDANGSTDVDDDIVSYMWDLDDDANFETDAGGQAIFDVNYAYLQSLSLIINYTYNIHVQVTDSEGQSDVNDSTLTIVSERALKATVDLDPDVFEVKLEKPKEPKKPKKPKKPKEESLEAFIEFPADANVADVDVNTVTLSLNGATLATAELPVIVDNVLDVLFPLDPNNVGTILGLEVTKVKVHGGKIKVETTTAPSQPIDLIELTVSGELMGGGSFSGTDAVRVMLKKHHGD